MKFDNGTISQHFLSQVEQRFNSFNLDAKNKNRKIFSFKVIDRDNYVVELEKPNGVKIIDNLTFDELFTFYKGSASQRKNLENAFGEYESKISKLTSIIIEKVGKGCNGDDISDVLVELLRVKVLNFLRNPFSIKKVLNSVGDLPDFYPVESELLKEFKLIDSSYKPHVERLCKIFNVTYDEYIKWIKILFLVLMRPIGSKANMLEEMVGNLLEDKNLKTMFIIFHYSGEHEDKRVCLSDRSWVDCLQNDADHMGMDFNLTSNMFLRFGTVSLKSLTPAGTPKHIVDMYMSRSKVVECFVIENDLDVLRDYNRNAVFQSFNRVFCGSSKIYGL